MFYKIHHNLDLYDGVLMIRFEKNILGRNASQAKCELPLCHARKSVMSASLLLVVLSLTNTSILKITLDHV